MLLLCDRVRECAFSLHCFLRHGYRERIYQQGLINRLRRVGIEVEQQVPLRVSDDDGCVLGDFVADLLVERQLLVELKACSTLAAEHTAQLIGYVRASGLRDGMLINFGSPRLQVRKLVL